MNLTSMINMAVSGVALTLLGELRGKWFLKMGLI